MNSNMNFQFSDSSPYPAICVEAPNERYAQEMLSNIGACNSEMSAITLYFYNSVVARQKFPDVAECFHKISMVEMHHLDIFAQLAFLLGADPRLWQESKNRFTYWSPRCNQYPRRILPLIENAIHGETEAIKKYQQQCKVIQDPNITANLNRIIQDERIHLEIFHRLYHQVSV